MIKNIFEKDVTDEIIGRINQLDENSQRQWGKMNVDQMLAHCSVTYAYEFEPERFKKPNFLLKFMLKNFVKKYVVSEEPYKSNSNTAPDFLIKDRRNFETEKAKLIANIQKTQELGMPHFEGKENFSFGKMTGKEWNIMFYKHLDHHLRQFGV
jgi:hypothetical protein